jgi:aminoglycoside phosphotransferase (APT) family kinase protein
VTEPAVGELRARARLALRERWPAADLSELEPLHGGISSLTFAATVTHAGDGVGAGARRVVVKVAPPGLEPVRNRDVLRQARVIRAVHGAPGVLVPGVLAQDGESPPFFVMEFVAGEAYEPKWDVTATPPPPDQVAPRARAAARMLARLQAIDPAGAPLGDEPPLSPTDELQRWARLFATAGDDLRGNELALQRALAARVPAPVAPRILHGDYRLGNMQFAGDRLAAVIDWEIWSVGDPRTDLAWLMAFTDPVMQRVRDRDAANQAAADAMPAGEQLLAEFTDEAGAAGAPADLDWFLALAYYKLGATLSVLAKRNRRQAEPDPSLELAGQTVPPTLERGLQLLRA